ncbi:MAG: HAD hydrolase family protein [Gemmataceae bacterium]
MKPLSRDELAVKAAQIELLVLDVDGVLTDGTLLYANDGMEMKRFHVRDGSGLKLWQQVGKRTAVISGRRSAAVEIRARELGLSPVIQGCGSDKLPAFVEVMSEAGVSLEQVCVVGDDLPDLPLLVRAGLAVTVADACPDVKAVAHHVTSAVGGHGAVREVIEWLLGLTGQWQDAREPLCSCGFALTIAAGVAGFDSSNPGLDSSGRKLKWAESGHRDESCILFAGPAAFLSVYVCYAMFLGGVDGLPVLPEKYLVEGDSDFSPFM